MAILKPGRRSAPMEEPRQPPTCYRKADVLYVISRGAQLECPHMINVKYAAHQLSPTLKDVKARLTALRGKGMPESFSWSYKRNYKDTFIWCDLFDDGFILPLRGSGEYVLKALQLFDVSKDEGIENEDFHSARRTLPYRSFNVSSPGKSSRQSAKLEQRHVEDDISLAISKSSLLIDNVRNLTSGSSMDLNQQIMDSLSHRKTAPEVCSIDHSDVSSSDTYPSHEESVENKKCPERQRIESKSARTATMVDTKRSNASSQTEHRDPSPRRDEYTGIIELAVGPATTITNKFELKSFSSTAATPGKSFARRRTCGKEIDRSTIYTEFSSSERSDDEQPTPVIGVRVGTMSPRAPSISVSEDPLLCVLRKAAKLGSYGPRLCRRVDVVDATRNTSKVRSGNKPKDLAKDVSFDSPVSQANSVAEKSSKKNRTSTENPEKQNSLPEISKHPVFHEPAKKKNSISNRSLKEFKSLSQSLETKESRLSINKYVSEPESVIETPRQSVNSRQRDSGFAALAKNLNVVEIFPQHEFQLPSKDGIDTTYRDQSAHVQMQVQNSGLSIVHFRNVTDEVVEIPEVTHIVPQEEAKKTRSESKGYKQATSAEHSNLSFTPCPIHSVPCQTNISSPEDYSEDKSSKQTGPTVMGIVGTVPASESSITRVEAIVESYENTIKIPRKSTKESFSKHLHAEESNTADIIENQFPESCVSDSHASHGGNEQGITIQEANKVQVAPTETCPSRVDEGARDWTYEQLVRKRDYTSKENRPLTPGLTLLDWERSFREAVMHSKPPRDLVLHECLQCGRTFKLDSLQVHMRGCHVINKPKASVSIHRSRECS